MANTIEQRAALSASVNGMDFLRCMETAWGKNAFSNRLSDTQAADRWDAMAAITGRLAGLLNPGVTFSNAQSQEVISGIDNHARLCADLSRDRVTLDVDFRSLVTMANGFKG